MKATRQLRCLPVIALAALLTLRSEAADTKAESRVPLIYSTDLLHPHDDPDDHFDLATLFSLPELDVKAILLDLGAQQATRSGRTPVEQMLHLTGRRIPFASGLAEKLESPNDPALDQPAATQAAVELLLKVLRDATQPVTYVGTGSARDLVAAFNRNPELLQRKLDRVYVSIGNAQDGGREWNVDLDPQAYVGLMRSGLPIYWCPCLPMERTNTRALHSTYWKFKQDQVLETAPRPLQNFFIYALQTVAPAELNPLKALTEDLRPWRHLVWKMERNMWSTPDLLHAAGRGIYRAQSGWTAAELPPPNGKPVPLFDFVPARAEVDDSGITRLMVGAASSNLKVFQLSDAQHYNEAMRDILRELFRAFPLR